MTFAEELPYFGTGKSPPDSWIEKAKREIEKAGGSVIAEGFGAEEGRAAFLLRFELDGDTFRIVWPVFESRYDHGANEAKFQRKAKRQAATLLYHDVKASCVKARALGARVAFLPHLELEGGRLAGGLAPAQLPLLLPRAT